MRTPLGALAGAFLGVGTGLATTVLHTHWWGLLLGIAACAAVLYAASAPMRIGFTVGWLLPVARAALPRPEGDYLVGSDLSGYLLLGLGVGLVVVTMFTVPASRRASSGSLDVG